MTLISAKHESEYYSILQGKADDNLLHLHDAKGFFFLDKVNERIIKYFVNQILEMPWSNYLLLAILIQTDRNLDPSTIEKQTTYINARMRDVFNFYSIQEMREFNVHTHMYGYLKGECFPEHSNNMRRVFLKEYKIVAYNTKRWLIQKLNQEQQSYFEQLLLPMPSFDSRDFSFSKLAIEQAQNTRKEETDAIFT